MDVDSIEDNIEKASELEGNEEFFSASHFYQNALKLLLENGDRERVVFCKNKIVEMNKKMLDSGKDLKELSFEYKLTEKQSELVNSFISEIVDGKEINDILKSVGTRHSFLPFVKKVMAAASRNMPVSYSFAALSSISNQGHLLRGGNNPQHHWFMKMYEITQQTILQFHLLPVVRRIMSLENGGKLDYESLLSYFSSGRIIEDKNLKIITSGLRSFFNKNYVSCLHVLVSQFEPVFLRLSKMCGIDIVALDQKLGLATRTKILSDLYLSSEEFIKVWGEDFCQQVRFILFDPLGYRLRHKIAHGEISEDECNFQNSVLIIYLFLVLFGRIKISNV
jgi:hypothetical protein